MHKGPLLAVLALLLPIGVLSSVQARPADEGDDPLRALASMLRPEIQLSRPSTGPGEDWYGPAAAYNSLRRSQIVFTHAHADTGGDIYGYYWSAAPDDWVWFWAMSGFQPAVAYNRAEDDWLLVAMYDSDHDGRYEIWGRIVAGDAGGGSVPFLIFQWANRSFWSPRVAWNSYRNEYLVVWNAMDTVTGLPSDVAAARVSASGTVLPGAPHLITTTGAPHQADVAYNLAADEYLVVWRRQGASSDWDIYGARLRGADAALISPPGAFAISAAPEDQASPAVTTNEQGYYMVVWEHVYPGPCCDWDIRGQELDVGGAPVGSAVIIAQTLSDETNPRVVARPGVARDYVAAWQSDTTTGSQIWASRWGATADYDYFQVAAAAWWDCAQPVVAITGSSYLFAYEGDSQGDPTVFRHIYARQWVPNAVFLPTVVRNWP